ncbi:MAG: ATP-binding protein [Chloroflexi bacterium]|nr:ATP-binding protein [Chloroflexota bacterium]
MTQPPSKLLDLLLSSPAHQVITAPDADLGIADIEPFPFAAIVSQMEMKLALLLAIINPRVGGVLLVGPRGTAKTTAVRSLVDLLPHAHQSLCPHGCTEAMLAAGGMAAICPDCAKKVGYGEPLTEEMQAHLVELPLNARLEDVVGGIDERHALEKQRVRFDRGLLSHADNNLLYIDEVNLLDDSIADAILDAAAQGHYTVRRGPLKRTYRSRFLLVGSMNPEEGRLRPQLMDRFGLRAVVRGLTNKDERFLVYEQAAAYRQNPDAFAAAYAEATLALATEIQAARDRLPRVTVNANARQLGLDLVEQMGIDSHRAEITLFEAARAHAAADDREVVTPEDVRAVSLLSLRLRQSPALEQFFVEQEKEDSQVRKLLDES